MTNEAQQLLLECYRRMQEHKATPRPPKWQRWSCELFDETAEYGPDYGFGEWFGNGQPEAIRMRFKRAIDELRRNGYLVSYSRHGGRLTKIKLTVDGKHEAERIAKEAKQ